MGYSIEIIDRENTETVLAEEVGFLSMMQNKEIASDGSLINVMHIRINVSPEDAVRIASQLNEVAKKPIEMNLYYNTKCFYTIGNTEPGYLLDQINLTFGIPVCDLDIVIRQIH
jgi:hypothetical protein